MTADLNDANRWQRLTDLLDEALQREPAARDAWLNGLSAADLHLRGELEELIAADSAADSIFDAPAFALLPAPIAMAAMSPGQRVGPWVLVREIGHGGMGTVWEAHRADGDFEQRAALKVLRTAFDSPMLRQRFRQERRLLARLKHRNIATLLDGGITPDGMPWFAMELVDGEPITQWCDTRRVGVNTRLTLMRQVCGAVQQAHRALVIHRDLKLGNILVTADGTVKLLDFGIAKVLDDATDTDDSATRPGSVLGTPAYMAPELVSGGLVSTAADIYALGVITYEVLAGHVPLPVDAQRLSEWRRDVIEKDAPPLTIALTDAIAHARGERSARALERALSGDLTRIVAMALRKEPDRRYASAEQLGDDLRRYASGLPVVAQENSAAYRIQRFVNRNRASVAAGTLALLTLVGGLAGTSWQARVARRERDRARVETAKVRRVQAFMEETFRAADPRSQGKDITIAQALGTAEQRASAEFRGDPAMLAALLSSIGRTYHGLGRYDDAQRTLSRALSLRRAADDGTAADVTESLRALASLEAERGNIPAAESLFVSALARAHREPVDSVVLGGLLDGYGSLQLDKGDFPAAESTLRLALRVQPHGRDDSTAALAGTINNLGVALGQQNRWTEAIPLHETALRIMRRANGPDHPDVATGLNTLANAYTIVGQFRAADTLFHQALAQRVKLLGAHHPEVAWTHYSYADMLRLSGDFERAIVEAQAVLAERGTVLPESHPMISSALNVIGRSLLSLHRDAEAERVLRESWALRRAAYPAGHWLVASVAGAVGECLLAQRRFGDAEPLLTAAFSTLLSAKGPTDQRSRDLGAALITLYEATRRPADSARVTAALSAPPPSATR
jgi:serine/threonine-protein kinase